MKKIILSVLLVICVFFMLYVFLCKYVFKSYYEVNKELPNNLSSGKSLAEYAINTIAEDSGKEFNVGEISAQLDSELKGRVRFILVEKKQRKPR